ncbi:hypothetical protein NC99_19560 [Sunxiuqinia dokdonensis]|uniref:Uncharacterized protein n=1 Tax=Sunxiuqinia dokdonensis TaxID=1409788 RepID=A0A0L8V9I2_9BACT|nr:hypothetical protein NC99_19560 [Sunxiuqinia dokdonensis]
MISSGILFFMLTLPANSFKKRSLIFNALWFELFISMKEGNKLCWF